MIEVANFDGHGFAIQQFNSVVIDRLMNWNLGALNDFGLARLKDFDSDPTGTEGVASSVTVLIPSFTAFVPSVVTQSGSKSSQFSSKSPQSGSHFLQSGSKSSLPDLLPKVSFRGQVAFAPKSQKNYPSL